MRETGLMRLPKIKRNFQGTVTPFTNINDFKEKKPLFAYLDACLGLKSVLCQIFSLHPIKQGTLICVFLGIIKFDQVALDARNFHPGISGKGQNGHATRRHIIQITVAQGIDESSERRVMAYQHGAINCVIQIVND